MKDNIDLQNYIKHFFHSDNGIPFIIFNKETGEAKRSPSLLSKDILKTPIPYKGITGVLQKINP